MWFQSTWRMTFFREAVPAAAKASWTRPGVIPPPLPRYGHPGHMSVMVDRAQGKSDRPPQSDARCAGREANEGSRRRRMAVERLDIKLLEKRGACDRVSPKSQKIFQAELEPLFAREGDPARRSASPRFSRPSERRGPKPYARPHKKGYRHLPGPDRIRRSPWHQRESPSPSVPTRSIRPDVLMSEHS